MPPRERNFANIIARIDRNRRGNCRLWCEPCFASAAGTGPAPEAAGEAVEKPSARDKTFRACRVAAASSDCSCPGRHTGRLPTHMNREVLSQSLFGDLALARRSDSGLVRWWTVPLLS